MAFTAKDVKALREKTGVGMMDCKKALQASDGDLDKAIDFLREKGLAAATKKANRIAAEGAVVCYYDDDKNVAAMVEVNSETDFVAKNEEFKAFVLDVAKTVVAENPADVEALLDTNLFGTDRAVRDNVQDKILSIGENLKIRRFERIEGAVESYIHGGGTVGVLVNFDTDADTAKKDEFKAMGKDIAMQVAAMKPEFLDRNEIPEDRINHEKEILMTQIQEDEKMKNKPEKVLQGIITGKMNKFCKEICLVDQEFVKSTDHSSVSKYVSDTAKELGAEIKILGFTRFEKGEGLEKREDNFADEVQSMMK